MSSNLEAMKSCIPVNWEVLKIFIRKKNQSLYKFKISHVMEDRVSDPFELERSQIAAAITYQRTLEPSRPML